MPWNDKVLDNLEQIYWSPDKIGLKSITRQLTPQGNGYFVPKKMLEGGRSLYSRTSPFAEWRAAITKNEELLNQVIEIAFSIAPSSFIAEVFFAPLGISATSRIETLGRETLTRHATLAPKQYTQHDGFYVSENAIVMMEMKLKARTSIEQYLKYCTLAALEQLLVGRKEHLGMIYLVPQSSVARTRKDLRLDDARALDQVRNDPAAYTNKSTLLQLLSSHADAIRDVGERLKIEIISWDDFMNALVRCKEEAASAGNETLENLMVGLINQILATPDCGLKTNKATR